MPKWNTMRKMMDCGIRIRTRDWPPKTTKHSQLNSTFLQFQPNDDKHHAHWRLP